MGFLSGIGSALVGSAGAIWSNSQNIREAAKNRQWQEYMSGTAHQREVEDLRKAGLNPMLSVMGGSGASVGGGATARVENPLRDAPVNYYSARRFSEIEKQAIQNETDLKESTTQLNRQQIFNAMANQRLATAQEAKTLIDAQNSKLQAGLIAAQVLKERAQAGLSSAQAAAVDRSKYNVSNWGGAIADDFQKKGIFGVKPGEKIPTTENFKPPKGWVW